MMGPGLLIADDCFTFCLRWLRIRIPPHSLPRYILNGHS
jgi:hypothetical protein